MIGTYISLMGTFTIKNQLKAGKYISPMDPMDIVFFLLLFAKTKNRVPGRQGESATLQRSHCWGALRDETKKG